MSTSFDPDRFLEAQQPVIERVLQELRSGRKQSHWMWFVFPQLRGLGSSPTANWFGIGGAAEAALYLAHPILGPRLVECTQAVNELTGSTTEEIFGPVDAMKFRSSMTLFAEVSPSDSVFQEALAKYYEAAPDRVTLERLRTERPEDAR